MHGRKYVKFVKLSMAEKEILKLAKVSLDNAETACILYTRVRKNCLTSEEKMLSEPLTKQEEKSFESKQFQCPDCAQWSEHKGGLVIKRHNCNCGLCDIQYIIECDCGYQDNLAAFFEEK